MPIDIDCIDVDYILCMTECIFGFTKKKNKKSGHTIIKETLNGVYIILVVVGKSIVASSHSQNKNENNSFNEL